MDGQAGSTLQLLLYFQCSIGKIDRPKKYIAIKAVGNFFLKNIIIEM